MLRRVSSQDQKVVKYQNLTLYLAIAQFLLFVLSESHLLHCRTGPSRGGSFPGPRRVWRAPPSLENTEKGVPGGFYTYLTYMHKIHFAQGRPGLRWGSLQCSPRCCSRMVRGTPLLTSPPIDTIGVLILAPIRNEVGPGENGLPDTAAALDGPAAEAILRPVKERSQVK